MSDWPEVKARLEERSTVSGTWGEASSGPWCVKREDDIRAALQRVEELERVSRSAEADAAWESAIHNQKRAEAAEAKLAKVVDVAGQAVMSLETIAETAGSKSACEGLMRQHSQVRGYALSRARHLRAALAAAKGE